MRNIVFRMDDVGASTKLYNVYSNYKIGNFLFLKYLKLFKRWGPYAELTSEQWEQIINILKKKNFKLTVALTACWVNSKNEKIPFPEKFPKQAKIIKQAFKENIIEIANHGLTHCVVGKHLPKFFTSVRKYHREFWNWIPESVQNMHIDSSKKILYEWLGENIYIFVPPGNVYCDTTLKVLKKNNFKIINSTKIIKNNFSDLRIIDEKNVFSFHDRDIAIHGLNWLENKIDSFNSCKSTFLRNL